MLDNLQVQVEDVYHWDGSVRFLLDIIQSPEGMQHLSLPYWGLLVELVISQSGFLDRCTYSPHTTLSLKEAGEWDKLGYWIGIVWMLWPPDGGETTEEDLKQITLLLSHQQPGAIQKLEQWMKQWESTWEEIPIPRSFQQIFEQVHNETAQQAGL